MTRNQSVNNDDKISLAFFQLTDYIVATTRSEEDSMDISGEKVEKAVVISVTGRMDAVTSPDFEKELDQWIENGETLFVVDLKGLDYISSSGLRSVLSVAKKLKACKGRILLTSLKDVVKEVFEISGFSTIIPLYESRDSALSDL